jgi:hypothetical protein
MKADILQQAAQALREQTAGPHDVARLTRGRVMASLHRSKRRRRWHVTLLVPIAAVLAGGSAWAKWGQGMSWQSIATVVGFDTASSSPSPPARRAVARVAQRAKPLGIRLAPSKPATATDPAPVEPAAPAEPKRRPELEVPRADPELAHYRLAHRAHFSGGNSSAALAAWDAYLRQWPRGRFGLEASYNRAICLVRLGQSAEARRALEPFANGAFGEYRREEAGALLEVLPR